MDCSTPSFPGHHQLLELAQTDVHWVSDAIQPSHPLSIPSPSAFNLFQHQGLFQWVSSSHQVAKVLEFQLHHQSFQWNSRLISFRIDWFDLPAIQETPRVFSKTTVQKHQFFGAQPSLWSNSHTHNMTTGKTKALTRWTFVGKVMFLLCICYLGLS